MANKKPKLHTVINNTEEKAAPIAKPAKDGLSRFKSKLKATTANVGTLQGVLPHHNIAAAKDFVRLHPDEENYWSSELCFVNVPIPGMKRDTLHLIDEDLAKQYLSSGKILRFSLALATKPYDIFFLCHIPTQNTDNPWNVSNLNACEQAKTTWVEVTSRKQEGAESYKVDYAKDNSAFPTPKWPTQDLETLILVTFNGRMIDREDHPALLRLIGAKPPVS